MSKISNWTTGQLKKYIDLNTTRGDVTSVVAGQGLSGGGTAGDITVAVDYSGSDSFILAAGDGTGITVDNSNDKLSLYDNDTATVKYVNVSQIRSTESPGGSDTEIQYNNGGAFGGTTNLSYDDSTGYIGMGVRGASITHAITLPNSGSAAGRIKANAYTTYSSRRYKTAISPLTNSLDVLSQLEGVEFKWRESGKKDYGFIAEEAGKVLPEIVDWDENKIDAMSMDYTKIIAFLVESVKDQHEMIKGQQREIKKLRKLFRVLNRKRGMEGY